MAVKNAVYQVDNGSGFDEINFKTIASQVKMANGADLETEFINKRGPNGYAKLPNGILLQWGTTLASNSGIITFPIEFPNGCFAVYGNHMGNGGYTQPVAFNYWSKAGTNVYLSGQNNVIWFAIGG